MVTKGLKNLSAVAVVVMLVCLNIVVRNAFFLYKEKRIYKRMN